MSNESIIALSSILIALSALIVTVWQGIVMRRHNRLSVTPQLRIHKFAYLDKPKYIIKNCGIGPAVITSIQFKVDGKIFPENGKQMFVGICKLLDIEISKCTYLLLVSTDAISPGEEVILFEIDYSSAKVEKQRQIKNSILRLGILINYKSIYNENYQSEFNPFQYTAG